MTHWNDPPHAARGADGDTVHNAADAHQATRKVNRWDMLLAHGTFDGFGLVYNGMSDDEVAIAADLPVPVNGVNSRSKKMSYWTRHSELFRWFGFLRPHYRCAGCGKDDIEGEVDPIDDHMIKGKRPVRPILANAPRGRDLDDNPCPRCSHNITPQEMIRRKLNGNPEAENQRVLFLTDEGRAMIAHLRAGGKPPTKPKAVQAEPKQEPDLDTPEARLSNIRARLRKRPGQP